MSDADFRVGMEKKMKSRCVDISVYSIQFRKNAKAKKGEMPMQVQIEANIARNANEEKKDSRLLLEMEVGEDGNEEQAFYFKIEVAGIFEWKDITEEEAKQEINEEGMEILLSFARTYLYDITEKSGLGGIVIPIMHFDKTN